MVFLFKTLLFIVVIGVIGALLVNNIPSLKQTALEFFNPALKETRLLAQIGSNLGDLQVSIDKVASAKTPAEAKAKLAASQKLVSEAKTALQQAVAINQKQSQSGLVSQALDKVAGLLVDKTQFPADHLTPAGAGQASTQSTVAQQTCRP